jgi:hypothetical protein
LLILRCKACRFQRCLSAGMSTDLIKIGRLSKIDKEKVKNFPLNFENQDNIVKKFINFTLIDNNSRNLIKNDEKSISNCSTVAAEHCNFNRDNNSLNETNTSQQSNYLIRHISNDEHNLQEFIKHLTKVYSNHNARYLNKIHNANILAGLNLKQLRGNDATLKE